MISRSSQGRSPPPVVLRPLLFRARGALHGALALLDLDRRVRFPGLQVTHVPVHGLAGTRQVAAFQAGVAGGGYRARDGVPGFRGDAGQRRHRAVRLM